MRTVFRFISFVYLDSFRYSFIELIRSLISFVFSSTFFGSIPAISNTLTCVELGLGSNFIISPKSTFCFKCFIILYCGSCKFCYFLFIETFFHLVLLLFLQKRSHSPKTVRSLLVVIFSSSGFSYPFSFSDNRILLLRSVRIHRSVEGKS